MAARPSVRSRSRKMTMTAPIIREVIRQDKGVAGAIGWQRGKPKTGYVDVPYVTLGSNPFDPDAAGDRLFWTEGEKDTDTITKMGGLAFTFGGGEGHTAVGVEPWAAQNLEGRAIVIPADNDATGRKQAQAKASMARKVGAKSVRIIEFKGVPEGEDVSWARENRGLDMEQLDAMADAAPEWIGVVNGGAAGATVFGDKAPGSTTWKTEAMRNPKTGAMLNNVTNVLLALEAMFPNKFTWDEFACCVKIDRGRMLVETEVIELQTLLQKEGLASVGKEAIFDALSVRSKYNSYHPIREEIESVEWDGVSRVNRFAADYLGCEKTDYAVAVGRMFLISMVARVYDPGCQCDYMLILEGPQGEIKSSAARALASERFFSSSLPDITTKDSSQHMRDKWLIEIGEMHRFDGTRGANQLKDFLTRRTEKYRPPYGRLETTEPRQCVFIGTINRIGGAGYLKDPTGNRRMWPLAVAMVKKIDLDGIERDRLQIFAEALVLKKAGVKWWPTPEFEKEHIVPEQDDRQEDDVWADRIEEWLLKTKCCGTGEKCGGRPVVNGPSPEHCKRTTVGEVAHQAISIGADDTNPTAKIGRKEQNQITAALARLGWERGQRTGSGKWWVPTERWFRRCKAAK
jgi:predicted P-loop ATPase